MSKHKTPESQRVVLIPPKFTPVYCAGCARLQNLLDGANLKIERLKKSLNQQSSSPTASAAAIWAAQNEEIERNRE